MHIYIELNNIRSKTYFKDFEGNATFFVTMVCYRRHVLLSTISNDEIQLTTVGQEISVIWLKLPERFPQVKLGEYIFMPDHFHGIVKIRPKSVNEKIPLSKVIHWFKTQSSVQFSKFRLRTGFAHSPHLWQRGYNEKWTGRGPDLIQKPIPKKDPEGVALKADT